MAGDPADVGAAPEDVAAFLVVEDVVEGVAGLGEVAARGVHDALGLTGGARRVKQEQRVLGVEGFGFVMSRRLVDGVLPPHVATFDPVQIGIVIGTTHDEDLLDGLRGVVAGAECFVDGGLERCGLAAAELAVGGDDEFGLGVVDAGAQRACGEPGEHDRVGQAEACAREHRDERLGDHRHVDGHAVAGDQADRGEVVGSLGHLVLELAVGEVTRIAGLADPVDRDAVALARGDVAVDAVDRNVEFASDEPLRERCIRPVEDLVEIGVPVQAPALLRPELEAVGVGVVVERGGAVRLRGELGRRRIHLCGGVCSCGHL